MRGRLIGDHDDDDGDDSTDDRTPRALDGDAYERMLDDAERAWTPVNARGASSGGVRGFLRALATGRDDDGAAARDDDGGDDDSDVERVARAMMATGLGGPGLGGHGTVDPEDLDTSASRGLSTDEARGRLARYGANESGTGEIEDLWGAGSGFDVGGYVRGLLGGTVASSRRRTSNARASAATASAASFGAALRREIRDPTLRLSVFSIALELLRSMNARATSTDDPLFNAMILTILIVGNAYVSHAERRDAIEASYALTNSLEQRATAIRDSKATIVDAKTLVPGDVVVLSPGKVVPADCVSLGPNPMTMDNSAITGERHTVDATTGEPLLMRSVVKRGTARALVVRTGMNTFAGRAASLVRKRERARRETSAFDDNVRLVTRMSAATGAAITLAVFLYLIVDGRDFFRSLAFSVVLLISATPLAIRTVTAMTTSLGVRALALKSAIVTRMSVVEDLASMNVLCVDKTGALTRDATKLDDVVPTVPLLQGVSENDVMTAAALATRWNEPSTNAVDSMILDAFDVSALAQYELEAHKPFDARSGRRFAESVVRRRDGSTFRVIKGPTEETLKLCSNGEEVRNVMTDAMERLQSRAQRGAISRALVVAASKTHDDSFVAMGLVIYEDVRRRDASEMTHAFASLGVDVKIVTADDARTCSLACEKIGFSVASSGVSSPSDVPYVPLRTSVLTPTQCDALHEQNAYSNMLAEDKRALIGAHRAKGDVVGLVSDGSSSDVAALRLSHVGVVSRDATDAAKCAADVVLAVPSLAVLAHAVLASRVMFARVRDYVAFRATCTAHILGFFAMGALFVSPKAFDSTWPDTFTLPVIALCVVLALDDLVVIGAAYDHASPSRLPERWRLAPDVVVAVASGSTAALGSIALLVVSLGAFAKSTADDPAVAFGKAQMCVFLKIALTDAMSAFSARTRSSFVERRPGGLLVSAFATSLTASCMLAANWPFNALRSISWPTVVFVSAFACVSFAAQDFAKATTRRVLLRAGWMENVGVVSSNEISRVSRAVDRASRKSRLLGSNESVSASNEEPSRARDSFASRAVVDDDESARKPLLEIDSEDDDTIVTGDGTSEDESSRFNDDDEDDEPSSRFDDDDVSDVDDFYSDYGSEAKTSVTAEVPDVAIAQMIELEEDTPKRDRLRRTPGFCASTLTDVESVTSKHDWWSAFAALQRERVRGGDRVNAAVDDDDDGASSIMDGDGHDEDEITDYDEESSYFDDASSLSRRFNASRALPSDALTALDAQCGAGTFSASLCRTLSAITEEKMRERLTDPAMSRLCVSVDFLDVSEAALRLASESLEPPFRVGALKRSTLAAFTSLGAQYDIVYSAFGFTTVPRGKVHAALRNFLSALRPGGLGFIAAFTEQSHDARFFAMYHAEKAKMVGSSESTASSVPLPTFAEQICDALSASGASYNVNVTSHVTEVDASVPGALESYLHGVAMDDGMSLDTMMSNASLGSYLTSCVSGDGRLYAFPQRCAHVTL